MRRSNNDNTSQAGNILVLLLVVICNIAQILYVARGMMIEVWGTVYSRPIFGDISYYFEVLRASTVSPTVVYTVVSYSYSTKYKYTVIL